MTQRSSRPVIVATRGAPQAIGPYSQAVASGGVVYLSGQIGLDPVTGQLVAGGVEAEARRALDNLCAVLQAAGSAPAAVLRTTVFLRDMSDFAKVNAIYATVFATEPPARSTVAVKELPRGAAVEIDAIALVLEQK
ncbi:MAG: Rid family detoxifying hydrolase [Planctomycetota bacterium]